MFCVKLYCGVLLQNEKGYTPDWVTEWVTNKFIAEFLYYNLLIYKRQIVDALICEMLSITCPSNLIYQIDLT